jgi:prepilin-type N-terminal cleavage/methylation domain-containing protein
MSTALSDSIRTEPARRAAFSLPEVCIVIAIVGLLVAATLVQWRESTVIALKAAETLEHTRSTRELIHRLSEDTRNSQRLEIYPAFDDREERLRDGQLGNYLVLHEIDLDGVIQRTIGYYLLPAIDGTGWMLHRHDSAAGGTPGVLPHDSTAGSHPVVTRAVSLPESDLLFRCVRDRAVNIRGEFGTSGSVKLGRTEFVNCTLATRS